VDALRAVFDTASPQRKNKPAAGKKKEGEKASREMKNEDGWWGLIDQTQLYQDGIFFTHLPNFPLLNI